MKKEDRACRKTERIMNYKELLGIEQELCGITIEDWTCGSQNYLRISKGITIGITIGIARNYYGFLGFHHKYFEFVQIRRNSSSTGSQSS